jgi:dienelactone hydrolase
MKRCAATATACLVLLCIGAAAAAQERRGVEIWSDGTRLAGDLWLPEGLAADAKRPAIVLAQGWGGVREQLNGSYATAFARAGFIVLTFDYRGWGDSESRLVLVEPEPAPDADGLITVRARPIREVVDPQDQILDILNVVAFLRGEPQVDADRIGLWGTSYGGGHVVEVAAREPRIAAVVAQVAYMGVTTRFPRGSTGSASCAAPPTSPRWSATAPSTTPTRCGRRPSSSMSRTTSISTCAPTAERSTRPYAATLPAATRSIRAPTTPYTGSTTRRR